MKIHYFYRREYNKGFYNLELVAWLEETEISRLGYNRLSFTRLERLRIFLSRMIVIIVTRMSITSEKTVVMVIMSTHVRN